MHPPLRRIIDQGEIVPQGYGVAWRDWNRDAAICYPVPLNVLLGWLRFAYIWIRFRAVPHSLDRCIRGIIATAERDAYSRGYDRGLRQQDGYRAGWSAAFAKIEADLVAPRHSGNP